MVFFDNVKGTLGGGALELALTGKRWSSRILQKSEDWSGYLMLTWVATSNQGSLTPDMRRRTVLCRLESDLESPEQRSDFEHPHIQEHVREHRQEYLRAVLTILRGYEVAGRPDQGLVSWGSFEAWSELVRNAIVWAGGADPYRTRERLLKSDRKTLMLRAVIKAWPEGLKLSSSEIGEAIDEGCAKGQFDHDTSDLAESLEELLGTTNAQKIGSRLTYMKGKVIEGTGKKLVRERDYDRGRYWTVVEVDDS